MLYLKKVHVGPFDSTITASFSLKVNQSFDNSSFRKFEMAMLLKIMGMNCKNFSIYRDSPVSAVSISAVFDLVRFTNSTKQH
jgi:hypothetical protein